MEIMVRISESILARANLFFALVRACCILGNIQYGGF